MVRHTLDVYCLVPYHKKSLCDAAPPIEPVDLNREIVFAFKNGRAMRKAHGGHSFEKLIKSIVSACKLSPVGVDASETSWIPIPRSGASQPSTDTNSDHHPARTLGIHLAAQLGGSMCNNLIRVLPLTEKRDIGAARSSLALEGSVSNASKIILLDDTFVAGATIASCAATLREQGHTGLIAAFCIGYDVSSRKATELHERKTHWRMTWSMSDQRPYVKFMGRWGM